MESKELMLGNYVMNGEIICRVIFISDDYISTRPVEGIVDDIHAHPDQFQPMRLSPRLLTKLGFREGAYNNAPFFYDEAHDIELDVTKDDVIHERIHIPYVHTLQNLYRLRTGNCLSFESKKDKKQIASSYEGG